MKYLSVRRRFLWGYSLDFFPFRYSSSYTKRNLNKNQRKLQTCAVLRGQELQTKDAGAAGSASFVFE